MGRFARNFQRKIIGRSRTAINSKWRKEEAKAQEKLHRARVGAKERRSSMQPEEGRK